MDITELEKTCISKPQKVPPEVMVFCTNCKERKRQNLEIRLLSQLIISLVCPVNRHATMAGLGVDEEYITHHPEVLYFWYIEHGGADAFAEHPEFFTFFRNVKKKLEESPEYHI
jgi:hypothetical protein